MATHLARPARLDPLEYVLAFTAFAAGSVDVITYTRLHGVLASAMTGNIAFLALYSAAQNVAAAFGSLLALLGFILGGVAGTRLTHGRPGRRAVTMLLTCETILLLAGAALWYAAAYRPLYLRGLPVVDILIGILSISMGLQSIVGKKINLSSIPTVVFTSTLTNIVIAVTESLTRRTALPLDTKRQLASFWLYFAGAFAAGLCVFLNFTFVILLPLAAAGLALTLQLTRRPAG